MNKVQKTRGIPTDYEKKNPKRLESAKKKGKPRFWKSFNYIEFGNETEGKKVENVYSNVDFQTFYTFNPLSWHKLYFSLY